MNLNFFRRVSSANQNTLLSDNKYRRNCYGTETMNIKLPLKLTQWINFIKTYILLLHQEEFVNHIFSLCSGFSRRYLTTWLKIRVHHLELECSQTPFAPIEYFLEHKKYGGTSHCYLHSNYWSKLIPNLIKVWVIATDSNIQSELPI